MKTREDLIKELKVAKDSVKYLKKYNNVFIEQCSQYMEEVRELKKELCGIKAAIREKGKFYLQP